MTTDINTPQQPDEPDAPAPLTVEQIVAGLTAERDYLLGEIDQNQTARASANACISEARARLAEAS